MTSGLVPVHRMSRPERQSALVEMAALHAAAFDEAWSAPELSSLLDHPGAVAVAAYSAEGMDGFVVGRVAADEAEVLTIVTAARARRRGTGGALLAGLTGELMQRGATVLFLEVAADNTAALALYRQAGFAEVGRRRRYYSRPGDESVDAHILRKALVAVDAGTASTYKLA